MQVNPVRISLVISSSARAFAVSSLCWQNCTAALAQCRADDQTDDDAKDEADLIVLLRNGFCTIHHIEHSSVFVRPRRTLFLSLTQRQLLL